MTSMQYARPLMNPDTRPSAVALRLLKPLAPREGSRRVLNVLVAGVAIVLTAPLMVVIAALIKLTSRGPVFFVQKRVGLDRRGRNDNGAGDPRRVADYGGRPFSIYKFRTMKWQPARKTAQVWATPDDPRVTPLGRILRKYRLDELPQMFNVLLGDMNIVGPRPEQPEILVKLRSQIEGYQRRQRVRPGITGWAQINLSYDATLEDVRRKVAHDLHYVARHSVMEDLKIMIQTAPVVLFKRGAW